MVVKSLKVLGVAVLCAFLAGCMHSSGLKRSQVKMLQAQGFTHTEEGWSLALPERLLFDTNSYELKAENQQEILKLIHNLHKYKLDKVKVVGHTDNVGAEAYNQVLSEKRASSVADIFFKSGYQTQNIEIIGRGMSQPVVDNDTEENRAENRRVAIIIVP